MAVLKNENFRTTQKIILYFRHNQKRLYKTLNKHLTRSITMFSNYVLNTNDGLTYKVTSNTIQSRNRMQVTGTTQKNVRHVQVAKNSLRALTDFEASICMTAEQILRNKKAMSEAESTIVQLSRLLKKKVMA